MFDGSIVSGAMSGASSPLISTPPESSSVSSAKTPVNEPPSPPMSDASAPPPPLPKARVPPIKAPAPASRPKKSRLPSMDTSVTPRPRLSSSASSRPPTRSSTNTTLRTTAAPRSTASKPPARGPAKLAPSTSLSHIRSLTAQMQRLEARVQSARSKLPGPNPTPPRASPRGSLMGSTNVTIRTRKRGPGSVSSVATSTTNPDDSTPTGQHFNRSMNGGNHVPRLSSSGVSRLSFGPLPNRGPIDPSEISRPSSRASTSSYARPLSRAGTHNDSMIAPPRPGSRAGGAYTPLGRPISRASFGNSLHGHSMSFSTAEEDEPDEPEPLYRTPSRRNTYSRTGLPTPTGLPIPSSRRQSAASVASDVSHIRRPSIGVPRLTKKPSRTSTDLGETY